MENDPEISVNNDTFLDSALRPDAWEEYVGQKMIKENLNILLSAAKERKQPPEHLLFHGAPGLGKTTLAHLISKETGAQLKITSGPAIDKVGDLASILTNLSPHDILFIDEVHRLNKLVEEVLYPAMEQGVLHIIIGKGPGARTIQLDLPPFTLIAATTRISLISPPLRSRFSGGTYQLTPYDLDDMVSIILRSAQIIDIDITEDGAKEIAKRARRTPRIANHLLKRVRDYAQVKKKKLTKETAVEALSLLGIDELGLTPEDITLLNTIVTKFNGGPVGLSTIATALQEDESTVEEVYEPYLIQHGLLEKTARGRVVTPKGYEHIGIAHTSENDHPQSSLL